MTFATIRHSVNVAGLSGLVDDTQSIAVFADPNEAGSVCIYTDTDCMDLTPETALEFAASIILAADIAASQEIK